MSIIQEALHRAEMDVKAPEAHSDGAQAKKTPPAPPSPRPEVKKIKKKIALNKTILTSLVLVALMAFALFSLKQPLSLSKKSRNKVPDPEATQDVTYRPIIKTDANIFADIGSQSQAAPAASLKDITDHPGLTLNGIMYIEEGPRAIINNSIVDVGDLVSGAKVTKINPKNVVLEYNDVEITLNLK